MSSQDEDNEPNPVSRGRVLGQMRVLEQAHRQIQTFFDELKNGTRNYRTVASLGGQVAQEYRGRCIIELLQNAHDALGDGTPGDPKKVLLKLTTDPEPVLVVANSGRPFREEDFEGICQLGQSPKDPNKSVGNKGLGFRSVLEVCTSPEVWSTTAPGEDAAFVFRFDPAVKQQVADCAEALEHRGLEARSPFQSNRHLLDWSDHQLHQYLTRLQADGLDAVAEAGQYLSPYMFPLLPSESIPEVEQLLASDYVSVVWLRLDGGHSGLQSDAVRSVVTQLKALNARSTVFLKHLDTLIVEIDGQRRQIKRSVEGIPTSDPAHGVQHQPLNIATHESGADETSSSRFHVWTREIGGMRDPAGARKLASAVGHLPNRWPEVRRVTVGLAIEETPEPNAGVVVIFLPTEMATGTNAYINAPFYGSLDRRQVNFQDPYNRLLLEAVIELNLDVLTVLQSGPTDTWRAWAIIDLISPLDTEGGGPLKLTKELIEAAERRGAALATQPVILCDGGWREPVSARIMPSPPDKPSLPSAIWRENAHFEIVAPGLDSRRQVIDHLLNLIGGTPDPTDSEWLTTLEVLAQDAARGRIPGGWNALLASAVQVLPRKLKAPPSWRPHPLKGARFLPTSDGRIVKAADNVKLFFQPARGSEDTIALLGEVPDLLKSRVAFLHPEVATQEGPARRSTAVQKFLDGTFARSFRREDLLRDVVLAAVPDLPAAHGSEDGELCAELLSWGMKVIGNGEHETLISLIRRLPVACYGGWYPMERAVFGPGWEGHLGQTLWALADELPQEAAARLRKVALLAPGDERWRAPVGEKTELFERAGVVDGLRLQKISDVRLWMEGRGRHELPTTPPDEIHQDDWETWRTTVHSDARPHYDGRFRYSLSNIQLIPEFDSISRLSRAGLRALWRLLLTSFSHWRQGWQRVRLTKMDGHHWQVELQSPLHSWLCNSAWLIDRNATKEPLSKRWLVPSPLSSNQGDRFVHLNPISTELARRLRTEPELLETLSDLGLNQYPVEHESIGPKLLEALAEAWSSGRVPPARFDAFVGQLRDAWRHLDPERGLPKSLLVRTGRRVFQTRPLDDLEGVYLPDHRERTRSLQEHGKPILEMQASDATRLATLLDTQSDLQQASRLDERVLVDAQQWQAGNSTGRPLEDTQYAWIPPVLLTAMAYGGIRPTGTATKAWREAADSLRNAYVVECETITVQLMAHDEVVAESHPQGQWLDGEALAIRRTVGQDFEALADALQSILGRQDLLKDLRLILGTLSGTTQPTTEQIEKALERAEIDAQAFADVRHLWTGNIAALVDRIRPVLRILGVDEEGLDAAASELDALAKWLDAVQERWPGHRLLATARRCRGDQSMGLAAWRELGDAAQLPAWNSALASLGERYEPVENPDASQQLREHLEAATPYLQALARHTARELGEPEAFHRIEGCTRSFRLPDAWRGQWWEVPFLAVMEALRSVYAGVGVSRDTLRVLDGVQSISSLRKAFVAESIEFEPGPYELAAWNRENLQVALLRVTDVYEVWFEDRSADLPLPKRAELPSTLAPTAYLARWTDQELLARCLELLADQDFERACGGFASVDELRAGLGLDEGTVQARRHERRKKEQAAKRERRTFDVAGGAFEVGVESYTTLFERLCELPAPDGPNASKDVLTALANARHSVRGIEGGPPGHIKSSHRRPTAELRELVGVVGEMHAYRFLRTQFGASVVTRESWVSEIRLTVLPLVAGEPNKSSDGHGFDFRFRYQRKLWHVEVKATTGDEPQFELGLSEIEAASRLARTRRSKWRILRISNALTDSPIFEWLPNPFEDGFRQHFKLRKGGMRVSYFRK